MTMSKKRVKKSRRGLVTKSPHPKIGRKFHAPLRNVSRRWRKLVFKWKTIYEWRNLGNYVEVGTLRKFHREIRERWRRNVPGIVEGSEHVKETK